jgi:transcriptional regulator with XRE-family HTH domain
VDVKVKLGRRIKELREEKEMSQKDFAYAADLDRSYIASIENGQRNVSIVNIEKIAVALGITIRELFNDAEFNKHFLLPLSLKNGHFYFQLNLSFLFIFLP